MRKHLYRFGLLLLLLLPLGFLLLFSFGQHWHYPALLPESWTVAYWETLFEGGPIARSLAWSMGLSLSVATVASSLGFWCSKWLSQAAERWMLLAYMPYVFSPVLYAVCLNAYFLELQWSGTYWGVFLGQLLISFPFAVIFFSSFWNDRALRLMQLGRQLGCGPWQNFWRVVWPLARPSWQMAFFQCFLIAWFEYGLTQYLGLGQVQTLTLRVYQYVSAANPFQAAQASLLLALPPILLLLLNRKLLKPPL